MDKGIADAQDGWMDQCSGWMKEQEVLSMVDSGWMDVQDECWYSKCSGCMGGEIADAQDPWIDGGIADTHARWMERWMDG